MTQLSRSNSFFLYFFAAFAVLLHSVVYPVITKMTTLQLKTFFMLQKPNDQVQLSLLTWHLIYFFPGILDFVKE